MGTNSETEIYSCRALQAPVEMVYEAFANPIHLKKWWGPNGFTNTIHEFDLQPGGKWLLTMHGPEMGNYENSSIFKEVIPNKKVAWTRLSQPLFDMAVEFEAVSETTSNISFHMVFKTEKECNKMRDFVVPNNEENFDRLETVLADILENKLPIQ